MSYDYQPGSEAPPASGYAPPPPPPAPGYAPPPPPPAPGYAPPPGYGYGYGADAPAYGPKSKIVAGILGILLGAFGAHLFYIGKTGLAIAFLLTTILTLGLLSFIPGIIGLIQGIIYLTSNTATDGKGLLLHP